MIDGVIIPLSIYTGQVKIIRMAFAQVIINNIRISKQGVIHAGQCLIDIRFVFEEIGGTLVRNGSQIEILFAGAKRSDYKYERKYFIIYCHLKILFFYLARWILQ